MKNNSEAMSTILGISQQIDWDAVYISELPKIYNFFLYMIGDREPAQELTAITLERAWRIRLRYRSGLASLPTWLFGIARNVLKEYLRKNNKSRTKIELITQSEEIPSGIDVERNIQQQQEKEQLRKILINLAKREQYLISLKYGAGLTNREIAKITNLSESNVGSILHRTVMKIRTRLEEHHGR